jgi:hypothetical protein
VPADERSAEIELSLDDARSVALELRGARAAFAESLPLAHEPPDLFLERLDVDHVLPQTDAHRRDIGTEPPILRGRIASPGSWRYA